jgi:hypothetical protein
VLTAKLPPAPALTAAGLGLVSGIISGVLGSFMFEPDWLKPVGALFLLDAGLVPIGAFYGVAIGLAVAISTKRAWAAPLALITTMIAWSAAVHTAIFIYDANGAGGAGARSLLAGLAAGAVGACLTQLGVAFACSRRHRLASIAATTLAGAVCGWIFSLSEMNIVHPATLYVIWQPVVALSIGLGLGRQAQERAS